jgi:hypothetical protein
MKRMTRREFLRGLCAVGVAVALEQIVGKQTPTPTKRGILAPVGPELRATIEERVRAHPSGGYYIPAVSTYPGRVFIIDTHKRLRREDGTWED